MASILSNERYSLYFQKVSLLYKRPEIKASLEIILSVFTVTILIFAAIRPTLTNIAKLQKKITEQEVINKKADNKISQLLNAQKQLETLSGSLYLFDSAVPDEFAYSDSAKRVEYLAKQNDLTIESLSFSGITIQGGNKPVGDWKDRIINPSKTNILQDQVNFIVRGKPDNAIKFLREIENIDRLAVLNGVTLSKEIGQTKISDTLRVTGKMTFYFYSAKQ